MAQDLMRYDLLAQDALRGVVRSALVRVERSGLPGEHHFYVSFYTQHPSVRISEKLRQKYEKEMTIVLQHQYWNLHVHDDHFEVELSFNDVTEKLVVAFDAIKGFFDPAAQFALQFEPAEEKTEALPEQRAEPVALSNAARPIDSLPPPVAGPLNDDRKIVSLDSFRKK
jgi:uncharacterized protein